MIYAYNSLSLFFHLIAHHSLNRTWSISSAVSFMSRRTKPKPRESPNGIYSLPPVCGQWYEVDMQSCGCSSWSVICVNACNPECPDCKENHAQLKKSEQNGAKKSAPLLRGAIRSRTELNGAFTKKNGRFMLPIFFAEQNGAKIIVFGAEWSILAKSANPRFDGGAERSIVYSIFGA